MEAICLSSPLGQYIGVLLKIHCTAVSHLLLCDWNPSQMATMEDVVVLPASSHDTQPLVSTVNQEPCDDPETVISTLDWFRKTFSSVASRGEIISLVEWESALQMPVSDKNNSYQFCYNIALLTLSIGFVLINGYVPYGQCIPH